MYIYIYIYMFMCIYIYIYIYTHLSLSLIYIYIYIYIHIERERESERERERYTYMCSAPGWSGAQRLRRARRKSETHRGWFPGNFASQDFDICLRNVSGSFAENCGDLRRLSVSP